MFKSYIDPVEGREATKKLPKLMVEGLLLGGSGLGVLALIFEIAADAFSVAAYQTLLAIHGAQGYHTIAIAAFILLSILLFLGIVPAYKAGGEVSGQLRSGSVVGDGFAVGEAVTVTVGMGVTVTGC